MFYHCPALQILICLLLDESKYKKNHVRSIFKTLLNYCMAKFCESMALLFRNYKKLFYLGSKHLISQYWFLLIGIIIFSDLDPNFLRKTVDVFLFHLWSCVILGLAPTVLL